MIDRRTFACGLTIAAATWPAQLSAQGAAVPVLAIVTPHQEHPTWPVFFQTLRELGYEDGRNVTIKMLSAEGRIDRLPALAAEAVARKPALIMAVNTPGAHAAIAATRVLPILIVDVGDPIGSGFVSNLARPNGNVTGISNQVAELAAKRLAVLKDAVPAARRIAVLYHADDPINEPQRRDVENAAPTLAVEVRFFPARQSADLTEIFSQIIAWRADAACMLAGQAAILRDRINELAAANRLPTMVVGRAAVVSGGLLSYYIDQDDVYRRAAHYVDKLLKGAKPADLPVEQPTKFELVVNLKTARAIGLTLPPTFLLRADEVLE